MRLQGRPTRITPKLIPLSVTGARVIALAVSAVLVALAGACGGASPPPQRGVLERNIDTWNYRRFQRVLDVEVWVAKNDAIAYTASYVRDRAEKEGRLEDGDVVNAFVTRYQRNRGILRSLVKFVRRLEQDSGYAVEERSKAGVRIIWITGRNEAWALWMSNQHIVKIGGRGMKNVPDDVIEAYGDSYPSRLKEGLLEGPLPSGPDFQVDESDPDYDPNNPSPDWDAYETSDPDAAKKKSSKKKSKSKKAKDGDKKSDKDERNK